jgi:hypothetical protein
MTGALDVADACARLARPGRPVRGRPGRPARQRAEPPIAVAIRDAADEGPLRELGAVRGDAGRVLDGGGPVLIPELPERGGPDRPDDPAVAERAARTGRCRRSARRGAARRAVDVLTPAP